MMEHCSYEAIHFLLVILVLDILLSQLPQQTSIALSVDGVVVLETFNKYNNFCIFPADELTLVFVGTGEEWCFHCMDCLLVSNSNS